MAYSSFGKQLYYLYLNSDGDKRKLNVNKNNPDNNWNDNVRFLVVPAPVPAPVPAASFFFQNSPQSSGEFALSPVFAIRPAFYQLRSEARKARQTFYYQRLSVASQYAGKTLEHLSARWLSG